MISLFQRYILSLAMLCVFLCGAAQKASVERMEMLPMDLSASKYQRQDRNGEPCALVRVEVIADGVDFFGDVIKPVEHKMGEYWVYMLAGSKMLQIKSDAFLPLMVHFADYGIPAIQPKATYVVTLLLPAAVAAKSVEDDVNYLVLSVSPAYARVAVDGKERDVRDGTAKVMLPKGTYFYHVEAPGYLPEDGQVTVNGQRTQKTVSLHSAKGSLSVSTATPGTEIYVNGERMGIGSWRGDLLPDTYLVEGRLDSYYGTAQKVTLTTDDTATVTLPALTPITGSLNIDYEPVGAFITVDGNVCGVTPSVVSKLPVGPHTITISADGYVSATLTATVTENQIAPLSGHLDANDEALNVMFKGENEKYGYKRGDLIVIPTIYDWGPFSFCDSATVKIKGKWGIINADNKFVIPAEYDFLGNFYNDLARVKKNGKWGFIDRNGKIVIPIKYDDVNDFVYLGDFAKVKVKNKYGLINKKNKLVLPIRYDWIGDYYYEDLVGIAIDGKHGYIGKNGEIAIFPKYDNGDCFSEGFAGVKKGGLLGKWGFIDRNDNLLIPYKYDRVTPFREGLAGVCVFDKWGFINKNDELVIPFEYDDVRGFHEGKAEVKLKGRTFYIDKNGNEVK